MKAYLFLLPLCALLIAACHEGSIYPNPTDPTGGSQNPPGGGSPSAIVGYQWELISWEKVDGTITAMPTGTFTLLFDSDRHFSGLADCNDISANYQWSSTGALVLDDLVSTKRACNPTSQYTEYMADLRAVTKMKQSGDDLWIHYGDGTTLLHYRRQASAAPGLPYVVHGKLRWNAPIVVPPNARAMIGWYMEDGTDGYYVTDEGTVNLADSTFTISIDKLPTRPMINYQDLACGVVFITTDQTLGAGLLTPSDLRVATTLGMALRTAVFYRPTSLHHVNKWNWLDTFRPGFSIAQGFLVAQAGMGTTWGESKDAPIEVVIDQPNNLGFMGLD